MKQIVISILKTIFKIIKAVLCVAGVMAVILSLEVTKNIIKDKENGDTNDSQEISIEVSGKIPVRENYADFRIGFRFKDSGCCSE